MNKKTEITIEIQRETVIRRLRPDSKITICTVCQEKSEMLTPNQAALIAECSSQAISSLCDQSQLHFAKTDNGSLLICSYSIGKMMRIQQFSTKQNNEQGVNNE